MHRSTVPGILFVITIIIQSSVAFIDGTKLVLIKGEKACGMYVMEHANGDAGKEVSIKSEPLCASRCYRDPNCVAADFDTIYKSCYLHHGFYGRGTNDCCTRYEKYNCSTGCSKKFMLFDSRYPRWKGKVVSAKTVDECKQYCLKQPNCKGVHVKSKPFTCYVTTTPIVQSIFNYPNTVFYMRLRCTTP